MRIISGQWRGRSLTPVGKGDAAAHLRPTLDRTRESLFSMLMGGRFGDPVVDARVLDLFAGTGALGLEALSRGAATCHFVENGRKSLNLLTANIKKLDASATISRCDATKLPPTDHPFGLIFLDPPYGADLGQKALTVASKGGWIAPDALIVWEESTPQTAPDGFSHLEDKRYGDTWITFLRYDP